MPESRTKPNCQLTKIYNSKCIQVLSKFQCNTFLMKIIPHHQTPIPQSIITKRTKASLTPTRQRIPRLLDNRTRQTLRKTSIHPIRSHLLAIANHSLRLTRTILHLLRALPARKRIIMIRQVHNRDFAVIVTSEEGRTDVVSVCEENGCWGDGGHFS